MPPDDPRRWTTLASRRLLQRWWMTLREDRVRLLCRVDTADEVEYYKNGGILHYVLRGMARAA